MIKITVNRMFQIEVLSMLRQPDDNKRFAPKDIIREFLANYNIVNNLWHACVLSLTQLKKITVIITSVQ